MAELPDHARLMREDQVVLWKALSAVWGKGIPTADHLNLAGRELLFKPVFDDPKATLVWYYKFVLCKDREPASLSAYGIGRQDERRLIHGIEERSGRGAQHFSVQCAGQLFSVGCNLFDDVMLVEFELSVKNLTEQMTQAIRSCKSLMRLNTRRGSSVDDKVTFVVELSNVDDLAAVVTQVETGCGPLDLLDPDDFTFERLLTARLRDLELPLESSVGRVVDHNPALKHHFPKHPEGQWSIQFPAMD